MKRKIMAVLLACTMVFSLAGCGEKGDSKGESKTEASTEGDTAEASDMKVAMITDSGDITDQSFNQTRPAAQAWTRQRQPGIM